MNESGNDKDKLVKSIKHKINATAGAEGNEGCTLAQFEKNYREDWDASLTDIAKKIGYSNYVEMLDEFNDVVRLKFNMQKSDMMIYPVTQQATQHQMSLINESKSRKLNKLIKYKPINALPPKNLTYQNTVRGRIRHSSASVHARHAANTTFANQGTNGHTSFNTTKSNVKQKNSAARFNSSSHRTLLNNDSEARYLSMGSDFNPQHPKSTSKVKLNMVSDSSFARNASLPQEVDLNFESQAEDMDMKVGNNKVNVEFETLAQHYVLVAHDIYVVLRAFLKSSSSRKSSLLEAGCEIMDLETVLDQLPYNIKLKFMDLFAIILMFFEQNFEIIEAVLHGWPHVKILPVKGKDPILELDKIAKHLLWAYEYHFVADKIEFGEVKPIEICGFTNPDKPIVLSLCENKVVYKQMNKELRTHQDRFSKLANPVAGRGCLFWSKSDGQFFRALIQKVYPTNVDIYLIDEGVYYQADPELLCYLPEKFYSYPAFAIQANVTGLSKRLHESLQLNASDLQNPKYKTSKCMNIKRDGKCPFGTKCSFIHPEDEEEKNHLYKKALATIADRKVEARFDIATKSLYGLKIWNVHLTVHLLNLVVDFLDYMEVYVK
uniref:C3H1-type domain-containing protein n=1 Tax=Acrobeloides nanus TaxID=290746 RepID=A0A914C7L4_9BILA